MIRNLRASLLLPAFCFLISGCGPSRTLSSNQSVRLASVICYQRPDGTWVIPIRGSVYERSWLNRIEPSLVEWLYSHKYIKSKADEARLESRLTLFLEDHPSGIALEVMVGETPKTLPTAQGGLVAGDLILTSEEVNNLQSKAPPDAGWLTFRVRNSKRDHREFLCEAEVLSNRGLSIVSDIDDTIKITDVNNTKLMLENTFLLPFRSVPGMAELYAAWKTEKGASFHYLSLGPVQLYDPLAELFVADGFPKGTMDLPMIKWGNSKLKGFMSLMDGTPEFKEAQLRNLIDALPERDYVLIGDSSQHDPEAYADTARRYPKQIKKILIRDVTCQGPDAPRYRETFQGLPRDLWQIFTEPAEIRNSIPEVSVHQ
jgi:uncharacterized protein DUF2183